MDVGEGGGSQDFIRGFLAHWFVNQICQFINQIRQFVNQKNPQLVDLLTGK